MPTDPDDSEDTRPIKRDTIRRALEPTPANDTAPREPPVKAPREQPPERDERE